MNEERLVIGVDVGTGSARAGVFDARGSLLASESEPIRMWKPRPDHAEQSSEDIWRAVGVAVRGCLSRAAVPGSAVAGISFDATCSLVALDCALRPLAVNEDGEAERNVIVWMDHRAVAEAEEINAGRHGVLRYVGNRISPEMEVPKLLWLKRYLKSTWGKAGKFFDLADYLTFRASGLDVRSLCTNVCKWTYLGHEGKRGKWDKAFLRKVGLSDLLAGGKVGSDVRPMGTPIGPLQEGPAKDLGLTVGCVVGVGIIDAHAGGLGLLGAVWQNQEGTPLDALEHGLALIGGTSSCHMAVSQKPRFIDGIWGPYFGAMVPGLWLTEGGQSAAGSAIDHVIGSHAHAPLLREEARRKGTTVYELLNAEIHRLQGEAGTGPQIAKDLHVLADFLGNRSPRADPHARAVVDGLSLDESMTSQALVYYACVQAVAYGTRDILAAMNRKGYAIDTLYVTGGGLKNPVWVQEHADATGCALVVPREQEAVLLGSAILAATAAGLHGDVYAAMKSMSGVGAVIRPRKDTAAFHRAKFRAYQQLHKQQAQRRRAMMRF